MSSVDFSYLPSLEGLMETALSLTRQLQSGCLLFQCLVLPQLAKPCQVLQEVLAEIIPESPVSVWFSVQMT
jgi:hypothetical protein